MLDRRRAPRVAPKKPMKAKIKTSLVARVIDISVSGAQVELPYSLPLRTGCDIRLQTNGTEISLRATVRRCSVLGWTEQEGKKVLLYRAGVEFEGSGRDLLAILAPKFPELFSAGKGLEGVAERHASPDSTESIEVTIHMGDRPKDDQEPPKK